MKMRIGAKNTYGGAESVGYIDQPIYKYYTTPGSTMHSFSAQGDSDKILMCYRRLVFISPLGACPFTHTVKAHCMAWISAVFSFRHMSRHSAKSCRSVFTGIDSEVFRFLRKFKWYGFARISIFHPYFTTFIIAITHPFTQLCRFFYRNGKKS